MNFETLTNIWLDSQAQLVKESTFLHYSFIAKRHLIPHFNKMKLENINNQEISKYTVLLLKNGRLNKNGGLSRSSASEILSILRNCMDYGFSHQYMPYKKMSYKLNNQIIINKKVFEDHEIDKMISFLLSKQSFKNLGLLISIFTGIRIGELCSLKFSDIDTVKNTITINSTIQRVYCVDKKSKIIETVPKSKRGVREIPISDKLYKILNEYSGFGYILTSSDKCIEPRTFRNYYFLVLKNLEIEYRSFHFLRHTFATKILQNTSDYKTVSELLGHSSVATTLDLYAHTNMDAKIKCVNYL